ncbi:MAG: hypothetical protein D6704_03000 [Nitrospirae bacterium]|nr:MAG: hypothetical protein D6704_03000 [Nitrospirota bacterium]
MKHHDAEQTFIELVKQHLNSSVECLDASTVARLQRARQEALLVNPKRPFWLWPVSWAATTCTALVVLTLWWGSVFNPVEIGSIPPVEDIDLLVSTETFDFYEDLDFYGWLAEHDQAS